MRPVSARLKRRVGPEAVWKARVMTGDHMGHDVRDEAIVGRGGERDDLARAGGGVVDRWSAFQTRLEFSRIFAEIVQQASQRNRTPGAEFCASFGGKRGDALQMIGERLPV